MMPMRRLALAAVAGLTLAAAMGCGNDVPGGIADPGPAATTAVVEASATPLGASQAVRACDMLSVEAVSQFVGQPVRVDELSASACVWLAETGTQQVHLQVYRQRSYFSPTTWGGTPEPIDGIGEEAFLIRQTVAGTVAAYWDGEHAVFLNYTVLSGGSSQDKADQLVELLRTIAAAG